MADDVDDLEIVDEEDQTLALDDDAEGEGEEEVEVDDDGEDEEADLDEEEAEPIRPPTYRPDSNIYTILPVLAFLSYAVAVGFVLDEMKVYCDPELFMWGMFK